MTFPGGVTTARATRSEQKHIQVIPLKADIAKKRHFWSLLPSLYPTLNTYLQTFYTATKKVFLTEELLIFPAKKYKLSQEVQDKE